MKGYTVALAVGLVGLAGCRELASGQPGRSDELSEMHGDKQPGPEADATMRQAYIGMLKSESLRRLAIRGGTDESVDVLVALDLPKPGVEIDVGPGGKSRAVGARPLTDIQKSERSRRILEYGRFLKDLLGHEAKWLDTSEVFLAQVNAEQLRTIAAHNDTLAVYENKERKAK